MLDVQYQSQFEGNNGLTTLCGPACLTMLLKYIGVNKTLWEVYKATGNKGGLVTIGQLKTSAAKFGKSLIWKIVKDINHLRDLIENNQPFIALINYAYISERKDKRYTGGHFIVVRGIDADHVYCNDPDYLASGEGVRYLLSDFEKARSKCQYNGNLNFQVLYFKDEPMADKTGDLKLRIKQLEKDGERKQKIIEDRDNEIKGLKVQLSDTAKEKSNVTRALEDSDKALASKASQLKDISGMYDTLSEEKRLLDVRFSGLQGEKTTLTDEVISLNSKLDDLKSKIWDEYPKIRKLSWRFGRTFVAAFTASVVINFQNLQDGTNLWKIILYPAIVSGLVTTGKAIREYLGENYPNLLKLPV